MEFSEPTLAVSCSHAEGSHGDKGEVASSKLSDPKERLKKVGFNLSSLVSSLIQSHGPIATLFSSGT